MAKRRSHGAPKLPSKQLAILAICRFAEPVALTSVFPYLPEMIESFGIDKTNVAKWAGITSAVFSLSQCVTAVPWGRASDKFGRKPCILIALSFTMLWTLMFGVSSSLPMAIIVRAFAGACNGNVGIIRTMVAEMVPEKELQPRAFSIMPLVWSLGSIFGPSFGGYFANPAENIHWLFGNNRFLIRFPFALPNIIASVLFMIGITTGIFFLKETLEAKRHKTDYGLVMGKQFVSMIKTIFRLHPKPKPFRRPSESYDESAASLLRPTSSQSNHSRDFSSNSYPSKSQKPVLPRPTLTEVFTRQSVINLMVYTFLALHSMGYDQLLPIFLHLPQQTPDSKNTHLPFKFSGGFGLKSSRIGTLFTLYGIFGCFVQFLIFPPVARKYGVLNCFKACAVVFPLICFITPFTALIQDSGRQQAAIFAIMLVKCFGVIFAFPCSIILLTNSASSLRILGTLNGIAVSISAVGRAAGPAMAGATFSLGLEHGYVIPAWWLLGIIAALGAIPIWWLVEGEGFTKDEDSEDEEESLLPTVDEEEETAILDGDEIDGFRDDTEEALDVVDGPPLSRIGSERGTGRKRRGSSALSVEDILAPFERRMSSPVGLREPVGPGGGRRLSNGLAASNMGQGTGGTSFA